MKTPSQDPIVAAALGLAARWQDRANALLTREERRLQNQMRRLLSHPLDKVILTKMMDQSFRAESPARVADQLNTIFRRYGIPAFFSVSETFLVRLFMALGRHFPKLSVPRIIAQLRRNSSRAIIAGEPEVLMPHLESRRQAGVRMNINHLGEAVLGEEEARYRLETYLADLRRPDIEYISVKISTIFSQISSLAFEHTLAVLGERLSQLYRAARDNLYEDRDGRRVPKFVNLDMEEYRDLEITAAAFTRTLEHPEFKGHAAGIVLQAYLPDSYHLQRELTDWARRRVADGGSPIKIRIVKGANMEMEQVEAALNNWPLAPYDNKKDVDANYKRMVAFGMLPENIRAVHLGVASHNLFDLAYACELARHHGVSDCFSFEMLEGMADHVRRAVQEISGDVLLYAPVATQDQFINAIAYLIRRLDENTAEENFLRHSFDLQTGSARWNFLKNQFLEALAHQERAGKTPHRIQDRGREEFPEEMGTFHTRAFTNEPDTDWAVAANRRWADGIRRKWRKSADDPPLEIPLVLAGREVFAEREIREVVDPNQIAESSAVRIRVARCALASREDVARAVAVAKADPDGWRAKSYAERHAVLDRVAMALRRARADLMGAAAANTGKVLTESDPEVSEAVDFAEFYPFSAQRFANLETVACAGRGVGLVITPWNFPIAIPCGGLSAALAAGNTVIFKPASAAVLSAWQLCCAFWEAGVSRNVLQFLPCAGGSTGRELAAHPDVDFIILTGGTDTGLALLRQRPELRLAAETGGKNATIVTAMSDRDQAIKNMLHSAFSNSGQKCSATSLLILEREVYDSPAFRKHLVDAASSLAVGSAWDFENKVGPLIQPPRGDLLRALTTLEPGESWALVPRPAKDNPYLWTPGIKWGVQPGSYTHLTEFFGPVLGVMRAENLEHAIRLVNQTGYGLTSGLESLDKREQARWIAGIRAGNLYINRGTTGAIVLRQPFGGMRKSALGAGIKAGSPNYVTQFMTFRDTAPPVVGALEKESALLRLIQEWQQNLAWGAFDPALRADLDKTVRAVKSYLYHYEQEFSRSKDYFHLRGQDNIFRYRPVGAVAVRLDRRDSLFDALARIAAVRIARCPLRVSIPPALDNAVTTFLDGREGRRLVDGAEVVREADAALAGQLQNLERIRYAGPERVPAAVFAAAARTGFYIARNPVLMEGRIEMLNYFLEQSICDSYHRYGNLGERAL
ncbi:MAG: bifunctional proline dehydrogenase/L-glutamate gamma-semialdehyde dehydrogenase [Desulfobacteraceae bacterium]|nr:bifunctional proline dehydrogenase/L-glutamate gamma-semialdehyde dehydrogenase [Desulfobacteraceae bacterium]